MSSWMSGNSIGRDGREVSVSPLHVRDAASAEQQEALRLLFADLPPDEAAERVDELQTSVERGELSLDGLLVAEQAGEIVGAGLFAPQPGRVGFVWPPGVAKEPIDRAAIQSAILNQIGQRMDALGLRLGQVLLDPDDLANRKALEQNGFPHLTDLHYLLYAVSSTRPVELPQELKTETFHPLSNSQRFVQVLERTYIGTLDCPELDGLRTPQDALEAHQATGRFDPMRWWLVGHQNTDAGLLLLNEHPDRDLLEIVYVGVVPEARGRGVGQFLVQKAIAQAHQEGRSLVLAVDQRNRPARKLYARLGFLDLTVQSVHVRQAAANDPIPQSTNYAQPSANGKIIS